MGLQDREYMRDTPIKPLPPIKPYKFLEFSHKPIMAWYCNKCNKYVKTMNKSGIFGRVLRPICSECKSGDIEYVEYK